MSLGVFDIESDEMGPSRTHHAMLLVFKYERCYASIWQEIAFGAKGFHHPLVGSIQQPQIIESYLPATVINLIGKDGMIKPPKQKRQSSDHIEDDEPTILRANLQSVLHSHNWLNETLSDFQAYYHNLTQFHHQVSPEVRASPVYHFMAFILNERHAGRCILIHNGSRFDTVFCLNVLKKSKK